MLGQPLSSQPMRRAPQGQPEPNLTQPPPDDMTKAQAHVGRLPQEGPHKPRTCETPDQVAEAALAISPEAGLEHSWRESPEARQPIR